VVVKVGVVVVFVVVAVAGVDGEILDYVPHRSSSRQRFRTAEPGEDTTTKLHGANYEKIVRALSTHKGPPV